MNFAQNELNNEISGSNVLSTMQICLTLIIVTITSKLCLLPSVLAEASEESAFWSVLILAAFDVITAMISIYACRSGGIDAIPKGIKKTMAALLFATFAFKFCAFTFEISISAADSLFETGATLPLFTLLIVGTVFVGSKGFTGVARAAILVAWACLLLLILNLFFIGVDGNVQNLFPLARPEPINGMIKALVWFGDPCLFLLVSSNKSKKSNVAFAISYAVSFLVIGGFYLLLVYTYGSALKDVGVAFSRVLLMNRTSAELGALDWPIMTVWLSMGFFHCSLLFAACKRCFSVVFETKNYKKRYVPFYLCVPALAFITYFFLFKNVDVYSKVLTLPAVALTIGVIEYTSPIITAIIIKIKGATA